MIRVPDSHACPWFIRPPNSIAVRGQVQVGIVQDDIRPLAAEQLQRQPFDVARDVHPHDLPPRRQVEPVKAIFRTSGWLASCAPTTCPSPGTTFRTPGGSPNSSAILANTTRVSGVCSSGLTTMVLPAASAGPDLPHGQQQRESSTARWPRRRRPARGGPGRWQAWARASAARSARRRSCGPARRSSACRAMEKPIWKAPAWRTGAPFSSASRTASSLGPLAEGDPLSRRARRPAPRAASCATGRRRSAAFAVAMAWSACSRPPLATLATSSSVAGLRISNRSSASTQSPPMNIE